MVHGFCRPPKASAPVPWGQSFVARTRYAHNPIAGSIGSVYDVVDGSGADRQFVDSTKLAGKRERNTS